VAGLRQKRYVNPVIMLDDTLRIKRTVFKGYLVIVRIEFRAWIIKFSEFLVKIIVLVHHKVCKALVLFALDSDRLI